MSLDDLIQPTLFQNLSTSESNDEIKVIDEDEEISLSEKMDLILEKLDQLSERLNELAWEQLRNKREVEKLMPPAM